MKRTFLLCFVMFAIASAAYAQSRVPAFNDYPVRVEKARAKSIDLRNSPGARSFRTRLTEALRGGVNFAGRYIVAGWGCGTGCVAGAIIDARTGRVYFPKPIGAVEVGFDHDSGYVAEAVQHRKNSRLLIISGTPGIQLDSSAALPMGDYYYEWRNNRLRLVRTIPRKTN